MTPSIDSDIDERTLLAALCPLIAMSDTLVAAIAAVCAIAAASLAASTISVLTRRWIHEELRSSANFIVLALIVAILELAMLAWFPQLRTSLGVFLPLVVCNFSLLRLLDTPTPRTIVATLRLLVLIGSALVILGMARELVGHGSLMHDAGLSFGIWWHRLEWAVFDLDMGFLLAMLPPGAFISLGLLLAMRNAWHLRRQADR